MIHATKLSIFIRQILKSDRYLTMRGTKIYHFTSLTLAKVALWEILFADIHFRVRNPHSRVTDSLFKQPVGRSLILLGPFHTESLLASKQVKAKNHYLKGMAALLLETPAPLALTSDVTRAISIMLKGWLRCILRCILCIL